MMVAISSSIVGEGAKISVYGYLPYWVSGDTKGYLIGFDFNPDPMALDNFKVWHFKQEKFNEDLWSLVKCKEAKDGHLVGSFYLVQESRLGKGHWIIVGKTGYHPMECANALKLWLKS